MLEDERKLENSRVVGCAGREPGSALSDSEARQRVDSPPVVTEFLLMRFLPWRAMMLRFICEMSSPGIATAETEAAPRARRARVERMMYKRVWVGWIGRRRMERSREDGMKRREREREDSDRRGISWSRRLRKCLFACSRRPSQVTTTVVRYPVDASKSENQSSRDGTFGTRPVRSCPATERTTHIGMFEFSMHRNLAICRSEGTMYQACTVHGTWVAHRVVETGRDSA